VSYEKNTHQVRRNACQVPPILSAIGEVSGYEIHMGITESGRNREAFEGDGRVSDDGLVFGTYLHGLFLNPSAVNALLTYLYARKGLLFTQIMVDDPDPYDMLADLFEEHVDIDAIVALLKA
jgi:adenosylcobyric acid synthase